MRDAILKKLTAKLCGAPASEPDVAYTLIEIRKLLERDGKQDQFATLNFFCDWVVHPVLSRRGAQDQISRLDARLNNMDLTDLHDIGPDLEIYRFISFDGLFDELGRFCREMNLPNGWIGHPLAWREFVRFYGEIVRDCPLEIKQPGKHVKFITGVILKRVSAMPTEKDVEWFELEWEFSLNDGRSFNLSAQFRYPSAGSPAWRGQPTETEFGI